MPNPVPAPRALALAAVTATGLAFAAPAGADLPTWSGFELQVRSNIVDGFNLPAGGSFNSGTPALSADGVAIRLISVGGGGPSGIWRGPGDGTGGVAATIGSDLGAADVAFASDGSLVFELFDVFTAGLHRLAPGSSTPVLVVPPGGSFGLNQYGDPTPFGTDGLVYRGGSFAGNRWIRNDGGREVSLVAESDSGIGFLFEPSADATGRAIGKVRLGSTAGSNPDEIRRYDGPSSFVVLAVDDDGDPASPFSGFDNSVAATPSGGVAFIASLAGGGRGVYLAEPGGDPIEIASTAHPLVSNVSFFPPSVNASGVVAFRGTDADGLDAVFVGDGEELVRLVGEHDLLDTDLGTARIDQNDGSVTFGGAVAIDDAGRVAFNASLTPESNNQIEWGSGVFIATVAAGTPGDVDADGDVDFDDLLAVLAAWGTADPAADLDENGTVDFDDLLLVLGGWTG